jgi:hypothetical protein
VERQGGGAVGSGRRDSRCRTTGRCGRAVALGAGGGWTGGGGGGAARGGMGVGDLVLTM